MALFEWYDYFIFAIILAVSLCIGIYFAFAGNKQKTLKDYLLGNRELGAFPIGMSIAMSNISAIAVIGSAAELYTNGIQRFSGDILGIIGMVLAVGLVPLFYRLQISSVFTYIRMRFPSRALEIVCALMLIISQIVYVGLVIYAPSTTMEAVTVLPFSAVVIMAGTIGVIYTTIGGMKSVVWTDMVQGVFLLMGMIVILVLGVIEIGGPQKVYNSVHDSGRLHSIEYSADPTLRTNLWISITWALFQGLSFGVQQTAVQRFSAASSKRHAMGSLLIAAPVTGLILLLGFLVGCVVFAHYDILGCDPIQTGSVASTNQLLIFYVIDALNVPCLPGILVGMMFAGALSSLSSSVNAMAAVTWQHFLENKFHSISENRKAFASKMLSLIYGALGIGFSFIVRFMGGNILLVGTAIIGSTLGPLMGVALVAALMPFANWKGTLAACVVTFPFMTALSLGNSLYFPHREWLDRSVEQCWKYNITLPTQSPNATAFDPESVPGIFRLSAFFYLPLCMMMFFTICILVSLATGGWQDRKKVPQALYVPLKSFLLPFCYPDNRELEEPEDKTKETNGFHNMAFDEDAEIFTEKASTDSIQYDATRI